MWRRQSAAQLKRLQAPTTNYDLSRSMSPGLYSCAPLAKCFVFFRAVASAWDLPAAPTSIQPVTCMACVLAMLSHLLFLNVNAASQHRQQVP